jgi:hypothetical protein
LPGWRGKGGRERIEGREGREKRREGGKFLIKPQSQQTRHTTPITWYYPIEVSILHLLIMLILQHVEMIEVKEPKSQCLLDCLVAV